MVMLAELGFSPEFEDAKKKLDAISKEYAALLAEYDELTGVVRAALETAYMMQIGRKEHQLFSLQIQCQQLKREISLYQAARNHGESISQEVVQEVIAKEFAEYKAQLEAHKEMLRQAEENHFAKKLSEAEVKTVKKLYHDLLKRLHPDLNPGLPPKAEMLWQKIVDAYKSQDWQELNLLADMARELLDGGEVKIRELDCMEAILEQQRKIAEKMESLRQKMQELRNSPPYSFEKLLASPSAVSERRRELDALKTQYEEHIQQLVAMRDDLKGES